MHRIKQILFSTVVAVLALGLAHEQANAISSTSLGYINRADVELKKVTPNEAWLNNGFTKADERQIRTHLSLAKLVIRLVKKLHRRINSQDNKSPEAKAIVKRLDKLVTYSETLFAVYQKGPRAQTAAEKEEAAKVAASGGGEIVGSAARLARVDKIQSMKLRHDWLPIKGEKLYFDGFEASGLRYGFKERPQVAAHLKAVTAVMDEAKALLRDGHSRAETFSASYRKTEKRYKEMQNFHNKLATGLSALPPRTPELWKKTIEEEIATLIKDGDSCYYNHSDVGLQEAVEAPDPRIRGGRSSSQRREDPNRNAKHRVRLDRIIKQGELYDGAGHKALRQKIQDQIILPFKALKTGVGGRTWIEIKGLAKTLNDARHKWPEAPKDKADAAGVRRYVQGLVDKMLLSRDMMKLRKVLRAHDCGKRLVPETLKAQEHWRLVYLRKDYQSNRRKSGVTPHFYWHQDMRPIYKRAIKSGEAGDIDSLNSDMGSIANSQKKLIANKEIFATYPLWARLETKDFGAPKNPLPPFDPLKPLRDNYDDSINWTNAQILAATPAHMEEWQKVFKKVFDELAEKLVAPEAVKDRKAKKLARRLGNRKAFAVSSIERKEQEMTETIEVTHDKVKFIKWTNVYDVFEFMWIQNIKGPQPWAHMKSDKHFCSIFRAIGIKYKKGRKVKKGKWLRKEDDHVGYVVCPVK